jgi:predicted secreted protein
MSWISAFAIFFVIWWIVLFTTLPFGVRSQVEESEVTLGTEHGAPTRPALVRKMLATTLVSLVLFGLFYLVTVVWGYGVDDLPRVVPEFD